MDGEPAFCYLTTSGRRTRRAHTVELWFGQHDGAYYALAGGRTDSDWVRNLQADPRVRLRIGGPREQTPGGSAAMTARLVTEPAEEQLVRELLAAKYQQWTPGQPLTMWARTALPVAFTPRDPAG